MCYLTFKEWALKQGWLELNPGSFILPNGTTIFVIIDDNDSVRSIENCDQRIWSITDDLVADRR